MNEESKLPEGWVNTKLEDICTIIMGQSPPSSEYNENGNGLPFFQGKAEFTDLFPNVRKWCTAPTKIAEANDILLSIRAPVGPTNLAPSLCSIGRGLAAIRPRDDIQVRYVLYAIRTFNSHLTKLATGTTFEAVSGDDVRAFEIPLAPLPEQQRIVAAIEQQFSRLDAGVAALRRAQAKLKRYRAAVLKAAVEGKLTETWRAEHPATESASELLERILVERRARWEADLRAKGKDPAKVRYVEPAKPDVESLPELPEGWCWGTVDQIAAAEPNSITDGPFGSNLKTDHYRSEGGRVIRLQNIGDGEFKDEKAFIALEHLDTLRKHRVFAGDLVIAALGENPPRSCVIPDFVGLAIVKADCIRFKASTNILNTFVNVVLNAEPTRKRTASQLHGIGRPRLNLSEIKSIVIPLPPHAEQEQIVVEVERRLSIVSELEATAEANLKRAERLRQSILKEAFAGRLVPQDPNDEPASVLLERIRADREKRKHGALNKGRVVTCEVAEPAKIDVSGTKQGELWESVGG